MSKKPKKTADDEKGINLDDFLNPKEPSPKLSNKQLDALEAFLDAQENTMHLELLDGFLCALITGPNKVTPKDYLPKIFGGKMPNFKSQQEENEILGYIAQHWEHIHSLVSGGNDYYPFLYADPKGLCSATQWAYGFIIGVDMYRDSWRELVEQSRIEGLLFPILSLYAEMLRPEEEIPAEERELIVTEIIGNLHRIYSHFHEGEQPETIVGADLLN